MHMSEYHIENVMRLLGGPLVVKRRNMEIESFSIKNLTGHEEKHSRIPEIRLIVIFALGIVCFRLSAWFFTSSPIGYSDPGISFVSRSLQFFTLLLLVIVDRNISYDRSSFLRFIGIAAAIKVLGVLLFLASPDRIFWYIGCGINGVCSGVLMLGWGYFLCSTGSWRSTYGLTFAFVVYAVLAFLLPGIPIELQTILIILCPLLSFFCLRYCISDKLSFTGASYPLTKQHLGSIPRDLTIILSICTIVSILAKFLAPLESSTNSTYRLITIVVLAFIFLFYTVWMVVLKRKDYDILWPLFALIIFSGLLCYSSFAVTQPNFATSFFRATQECFMLFCWIVAASAINRLQLPRVFFFGLTVLIFLSPITLVSLGLSFALPAANVDPGSLSIIITATIALILTVATVVLILLNSVKNTRNAYTEQAHSFISKAADTIIVEYGLTKREGEVLHLLITGQSLSGIAETLFISINTVRSHVKSVYRKIGINEKQQLVTLVEENVQLLLLMNPHRSRKKDQ